ncbi:Heterokaryon incompatibility protein 6, OR allele [Cercospora beticola]|uniref:Heterokaryon incompatibility protein 6, OR allele n=1 Tax=Cercospora beticola TaxID=122368 RepID=A0A2G5HL61_CERBT|nr:Heterokaryon incompatibility protein 6, OR allele [Cercospora beticola]PIA93306.1 Heterokaryon incompatibility protein 6, OR allele [Cercospora beticola]WPB01294.1 hypothetical protein RHO25_005918 [Cercospora beticola]
MDDQSARLPVTGNAPATGPRASEGLSVTAPSEAPTPHGLYNYKPLAQDNSNIRVLIVNPGKFDDEIQIQLMTVPFNGPKRKLPYEALSYTWGSPEDPQVVQVKLKDAFQLITVTRNCLEAIRYLRRNDKPRMVWIDAICINQADLDERARQVAIMRDIYARALRVVVWIGPASSDSGLAFRWIELVRREVWYDVTTMELHPVTSDSRRADMKEVLASEAELEAFTNLIERPYFERLWVWQEVRMGGQNVKLQCGNEETTFASLMNIVNYCCRKLVKGDIGVRRLTARGNFIRLLPLAGQFSSLDAINTMRICQCADPRDRIYTAQAFAPGSAALQLAIDYRRAIWEVYTEYTLRHLVSVKDLDFLLYVGDDVPHENGVLIDDLPSWVPDWSRQNTAERLALSFASGTSAASIVRLSPDERRLTVRGVHVGKVAKTHPIGVNLLTHKNSNVFRRTLHDVLEAALPKELKLQSVIPPNADPKIWPQGTDRSLFLQLVRVLTTDSYAEHYVPNSSRPTFKQVERFVIEALWNIGPEIVSLETAYVIKSFYNCRGRSLFTTGDGQLGLGPHNMQEGDCMAVLLGCPAVMILRPQADTNDNTYEVIGNAVCTGLMDGEALLGPLPEQYETVNVLNASSGAYRPAFRDKPTGEVIYEDPRLPPLSPTWKNVTAQTNNEDAPLCWRNQETNEWRHYLRDPRLDADALTGRGCNLQEFCLV